MDNVNNLNGIPNFGHGYPEEKVEVVPTVEEVVPLDGEDLATETEAKPKKTKKK